MAVKIRLMRIGAKGRPFYRVVAVDERKKRTGSYLELLGTYNPLTQPKEINLKQDRIDAWIKNGAQMSTGFLRIIGKAPQRVARKPKKDKGGSSSPAEAPATSETKTAETVVVDSEQSTVGSQKAEKEEALVENAEPQVEVQTEEVSVPAVEETKAEETAVDSEQLAVDSKKAEKEEPKEEK